MCSQSAVTKQRRLGGFDAELAVVLEAGIQDQGVHHLVSGSRAPFPVLQIAVFSLYILTWGRGGRRKRQGWAGGRKRQGRGKKTASFYKDLLLLEQGSTLTISLHLNHPL